MTDYILRHVNEGRVYVGVEGGELTLPFAVKVAGNKAFIFSSDFPHEVNHETCKEEIAEIRENPALTDADKAAILHGNAERFYGLN
ncbi:MAG: amidohydrolase family protein [Chloroflexi bacterium]|nr:amidohydrolase family protein [Chloroflexota bacterium]